MLDKIGIIGNTQGVKASNNTKTKNMPIVTAVVCCPSLKAIWLCSDSPLEVGITAASLVAGSSIFKVLTVGG